MVWTVKYRKEKKIEETVRKFRKSTKKIFYRAIKDLQAQGPHPKGWDTADLNDGTVRLKIDYRHRLIYEIYKNVLVIKIIKVSSREGAYK